MLTIIYGDAETILSGYILKENYQKCIYLQK